MNYSEYISIDGNRFILDNEYLFYMNKKVKYSPKSNRFCYRWINNPKNFELPERKLIRKYMPKEAKVLELGGYIGTTACLINSIIENKNFHTVSEIDPFLRSYLNKNKLLNACQFNIIDQIEYLEESKIYDTIISDIEGDEYLFILNNKKYIQTYIKLMIVEFHSKYYCKNKKTIEKKIKKDCHKFLDTYFQKIETNKNTIVYKKY
jgi:hypothetical protein